MTRPSAATHNSSNNNNGQRRLAPKVQFFFSAQKLFPVFLFAACYYSWLFLSSDIRRGGKGTHNKSRRWEKYPWNNGSHQILSQFRNVSMKLPFQWINKQIDTSIYPVWRLIDCSKAGRKRKDRHVYWTILFYGCSSKCDRITLILLQRKLSMKEKYHFRKKKKREREREKERNIRNGQMGDANRTFRAVIQPLRKKKIHT